jgi:hypothetical protein
MRNLRVTEVGLGVAAFVFVAGCVPRGKGPEGLPVSQGPYENPPLPETVWKPLTRTFEKLARGIPVVARKDLLEKHFPSSQVQVRVAIIDAAAEEQADPRRPPVHARSVQRIVESLYCDGIGSPQCPKLVAVHPLDVQSRRGTDRRRRD